MTVANRIKAGILLGLALLVFVGSDGWFAILDDENEFVTLAHQPLSATVDDYLYRDGQPEHPPLAGVILHWWLPIGGAAKWSLRIPSAIYYLAGLVGFAWVARRLSGNTAFFSLLWIGILWPFGFHFGRIADWYSLSFFLVAMLTITYLRHLERPSGLRLGAFLLAAVLLVYTTYYGWIIVGCLIIDFSLVLRQRDSLRFISITIGAMALAYLPLWRVFANQILYASNAELLGSTAIFSRALYAAYNLYVLFVSESVAPWFWYASIPISIGIAASVTLMAYLIPQQHRRYLVYFALLFGGMVVLNIINTKRLLGISGWLLVAFAIALANTEHLLRRRLLAVLLAMLGAAGWVGILARDYYAAPRFIAPWDAIADDAAIRVAQGDIVISNNTSFLFSMNYALYRRGLAAAASVPGMVEHPSVFSVDQLSVEKIAGMPRVLYVDGVNANLEVESARTSQWLANNCDAVQIRRLVPDTGFALKEKFFPNTGQEPFRVILAEYDCSRRAAR